METVEQDNGIKHETGTVDHANAKHLVKCADKDLDMDHETSTADHTIDKHVITTCDDEESIFEFITNCADEVNCRIHDLEIRLQEVGGHFVKYQENVAGILVKECARISQQMQFQKDKIQENVHNVVKDEMQGNIHDLVHEAVSSAKEEIMKHIIVGQGCKQVSLIPSDSSLKLAGETTNLEESLTQETSSTASVCEDAESNAEILRLMSELRKSVDAAQSDLKMHKDMTEERLKVLEVDKAKPNVLQDKSDAGSGKLDELAFPHLTKFLKSTSHLTLPCMSLTRPKKRYPDSLSPSCSSLPNTPLPQQGSMNISGSNQANETMECDKILAGNHSTPISSPCNSPRRLPGSNQPLCQKTHTVLARPARSPGNYSSCGRVNPPQMTIHAHMQAQPASPIGSSPFSSSFALRSK